MVAAHAEEAVYQNVWRFRMGRSELDQEELEERQSESALLEEEFREETSDETSGGRKRWKLLLEWAIYITIVVVGIFVVPRYVMQRTIVSGDSMENTLYDGESLLVSKISYELGDPERFDVIIFYPHGKDGTDGYGIGDADEFYVKRVIGLPGETVQIVGEDILINGKKLEENYGKDPIDFVGIAREPVTLGKDEYFVLGDNREVSYDSRYEEIGPIKRKNIEAKVVLRIWPLSEFGTID